MPILLTLGMYDPIMSIRWEVWAQKLD